jgi:hypothetical protein
VLNIYLPADYDADTTRKYPVIYLLDGSANEDFVHICGIVQFLNMIEYLPPCIVVGIANTDRARDFTFPATEINDKMNLPTLPTAGGSAKFMRFTADELLPWVHSHYRINDSSTLIGQSLGGLMATQFLLERPQLFSTYIIVSPSLWWDKESLLTRAPSLLKAHSKSSTAVYIAAGGKEEEFMQKDAQQLAHLLKKNTTMNVIYAPEPRESHLTILHNCIYNALVWLNGKR